MSELYTDSPDNDLREFFTEEQLFDYIVNVKDVFETDLIIYRDDPCKFNARMEECHSCPYNARLIYYGYTIDNKPVYSYFLWEKHNV